MNEFAALNTIDTTAIPPGIESTALRRFLRAHTAEVHGRLDASFGDFSGAEIVANYHRFVQMNLLAHHGLAAFFEVVGAADTVSEAADAALKQSIEFSLTCLEDDCATMALDCPPAHGFDLSPCEISEMAGLAYVLDGSRLGARFIFRRLEKAGLLGDGDVAVSSRYLRSSFDGHGRGPLAFDVISQEEDSVIEERALKAALAAFDLFERSLHRVVLHEGGKEPVQ